MIIIGFCTFGGGYIQRYFLCPQFNLVLWFRVLSYLKSKGGFVKFIYVLLCYHYRWKCAKLGVDLRENTKIGKGLWLAHCGGIVVNSSSTIGENCLLFQGVTIGGMIKDGKNFVPKIGNNVIIFAGAKIIGGVSIGNDVVIGANAVVTHDVVDGAVVAGIPAKVISMNGKEYAMLYAEGRG